MIRLLHTADIHARRDLMDDTLDSLREMHRAAEDREVDLIAVSGDVWDSATMASDHARFPEFLDSVASLADVAPVAMVYGTPSHDVAGSLDVFERLKTRHGITILRPGTPYFLSNAGRIEAEPYSRENPVSEGKPVALILGIPEPSKSWLLANQNGMSKAEADEAIEQGLRRLLLGLAAIRKEHADLPCVLLYHGAIRGGKYQNGQPIDDGIGIDDLASVGADYYALGDIHEPQQIGTLPAYYPGSIVAQNWGETHQTGFNVVAVEARAPAHVSRIDLPHPRLKKITVRDPKDLSPGLMMAATGFRTWIEISAGRGDEVDAESIQTALLERYGAAAGTRVTTVVKPEETVRAGEIAEKKRLRDKVTVWAENTAVAVDDAILDLADVIEDSVRASVSGSLSAAAIQLDRVEIRGSIGFWKKQKLDEVALDFRHHAGVIALVGPNGYGKTTLIENAHPWPQMLTRDGKLQDHFRLRDSWRKLWWTDIASGMHYRAEILIDGKNKSGGVEHLLYRSADGQAWEPFPGINGRREPYMEAVDELFGSLPMYLRTAFVTQRPSKSAPELSEATKGERKQLFAELAGIDYFESYRAHAKAQADTMESDIVRSEGRLSALSDQLQKEPDLREQLEVAKSHEVEARRILDKVRKAGEKAKSDLDTAQAYAAQHAEIKRKIEALHSRIKEKKIELERAARTIAEAESAVSVREEAEARIAEYDKLTAQLAVEKQRKSDHTDRQNELYRAYDRLREERDRIERALQKEIEEQKELMRSLERERETVKSRIAHISEALDSPSHTNCPSCSAPLPWATDEADRRESLTAELLLKRTRLTEIESEVMPIEQRLSALRADIESTERPEKPREIPFEDSEIRRIESRLFAFEIEADRAIIARAQQAAAEIAATKAQSEAIGKQIRSAEQEMQDLPFHDPGADAAAVAAGQRYEAERDRYTEVRARIAEIETRIQALAESLRQMELTRSEAQSLRLSVAGTKEAVARWRLLERACGKDGIPALELDAVAPSVAAVANNLLDAAYGSRYAIEFRTTRMGGSGARQKQIEDFLIYITDTETGEEQEISTLSGGESVWIKRAIYDAFAVIRAQNTGVKFLSCFQDETDGALDPDARVRYLRMLEEAHKQSGRAHTVLITHSSELQAMISDRVDVRDLISDGAQEAAA